MGLRTADYGNARQHHGPRGFALQALGANEAQFGAGWYQLHRADLLNMLARALPPGIVETNRRCVSVETSDRGAMMSFADGARDEADVVVRCDGIHSTLRNSLYGADEARFIGHMCWRALVPTTSLPAGFVAPDMTIRMGKRGHVVTYYVRRGAVCQTSFPPEWPIWPARDPFYRSRLWFEQQVLRIGISLDELLFARDVDPELHLIWGNVRRGMKSCLLVERERCSGVGRAKNGAEGGPRNNDPDGAASRDRDRLTPRADARDLSVSAGVTRAPTVPFGPTARTRIVLRRRGLVGGRHISLLFLDDAGRKVGWLRLAVSDRSFRNSEAPGALGARICSETGHTYQAASVRGC